MTVRIQLADPASPGLSRPYHVSSRHSMRGKLGLRRPGESRFSLQICGKALAQMGGHMQLAQDGRISVDVCLPTPNAPPASERNSSY